MINDRFGLDAALHGHAHQGALAGHDGALSIEKATGRSYALIEL